MSRPVAPIGLVFPLLVLLLAAATTHSLSLQHRVLSRRKLMGILSAGTAATTLCSSANAACLPGDLSKECIGVYKVPLDETTSGGLLDSPEAVQRNAPNLNYVPPTMKFPATVTEAVQQLQAQRTAADDIRSVVAAGRLEEAGIKVLNLLPRVTAAGRVVVDHVAQTTALTGGAKDVQLLQLQSRLDETLGSFGQVDVSIGQGLRGELGVVTVAQLTILGDLKDAMIAFDDFLQQIPS